MKQTEKMIRTNRMVNVVLAVVWVLLLAALALVLFSVYQLKMLPNRYFLLLSAGMLLFGLLAGVLLLCGRKGGRRGNVLRLIAAALVVLLAVGCAFAASAVAQLRKTLQHITDPTDQGITMAVYVRKDDPARSLEDLKGGTFAVMQGYRTDKTGEAVTTVSQALNGELTVKEFASAYAMADALYAGEVNAMILNSGYVDLLEEIEGYGDFTDRTRILYHTVVSDQPAPAPSTEPSSKPTQPTQPSGTAESTVPSTEPQNLGISGKPFVIYLSGSDTRNATLKTSRSDVNILVVVNPKTKQVLLLNTPRDYYVENPAGNWERDKLTHCGIYGTDCSMQALERLYGIPVDYYAQINFTGFEKLIDAIGGITVYADYAFTTQDTVYVQQGENTFNGREALSFARERYNAGGDNGRGRNQMKLLTAVIEKLSGSSTLITRYSDILQSLQGMFKTSLEMDDIGDLVRMQLDDMAHWNVVSYAVTGKGGSDITYSMPGRYLYVMYVNQDLVDRGTALAQKVLDGETLTAQDVS